MLPQVEATWPQVAAVLPHVAAMWPPDRSMLGQVGLMMPKMAPKSLRNDPKLCQDGVRIAILEVHVYT